MRAIPSIENVVAGQFQLNQWCIMVCECVLVHTYSTMLMLVLACELSSSVKNSGRRGKPTPRRAHESGMQELWILMTLVLYIRNESLDNVLDLITLVLSTLVSLEKERKSCALLTSSMAHSSSRAFFITYLRYFYIWLSQVDGGNWKAPEVSLFGFLSIAFFSLKSFHRCLNLVIQCAST